ncbi:MAG: CinA family nicotinamide mononucleotide deamidase-related protein [Phycisphaeraceae bacterium]|nr:CinA family nicotinamide mononucleotide deamidase-related protein [Phycisphaeraceae bacterium]
MTTHDTCAILAVGDELSLGEKLDTNSMWLAERLATLGSVPVEHVTVGDDLDLIASTMRRLAQRVPLLLVTGGLGPTADDLTRDALSLAMDDALIRDDDELAHIAAFFAQRGRAISEINKVQAMRPTRARCLRNLVGTAPGLHGRIDREGHAGGCDVFCVPGPPREMQPMVERLVVPALSLRTRDPLHVKLVRVLGLAESDAAATLKACPEGDLLARANDPVVGVTASAGELTFRIRARGDAREAHPKLEWAASQIRGAFGALCMGEDDESAPAAALRALRERNETLVVVESCTGGLLGATLTEVPGSSDVVLGGWITYSNAMKTAEVGVPAHAIEHYGAVSEQTVRAMAEGALVAATGQRANHALAISGVAGPSGDAPDKPVGTVWIAHAFRTREAIGSDARLFNFPGDRAGVRIRAVRAALAMLHLRVRGETYRLLANEQGRGRPA